MSTYLDRIPAPKYTSFDNAIIGELIYLSTLRQGSPEAIDVKDWLLHHEVRFDNGLNSRYLPR